MMILCPHCKKPFLHVKHKITGTKRERFMKQVYEAPNGCWIWMGGHGKRGYPHFNWAGKTLYAHRVSLEFKLGRPIRPGLDALHSCPDGDNPLCVNPDHLSEGTHDENMRQMIARGRRRCYGEKARTAILKEDQVIAIRARAGGSLSARELAIEYGIRPSTVRQIVQGRSWRHLLPQSTAA
jgi:hypothetical protein